MLNTEQLYDNLMLLQGVSNKDEPIVVHENRIMTISAFNKEVEEFKNSMKELGVDNYTYNSSVVDCQKLLKDRIITLGLPLKTSVQEITAKSLEESIITKLVDEYQQTTNLSKEEVMSVINQVIAENAKINDINIFNILVKFKLDNIKQAKQKQKKSSDNPLINEIVIELEKIAVSNGSENLFPLNIEAEINILQKSDKTQLEEMLASLKQINQTEERNNILEVEYNCLNESAKKNISLDDFKKNTNILVNSGYALNTAYDLIKDATTNSNTQEKFNDEIAVIYRIINNNNQDILKRYHLLSAEKKQFITQFQFKQVVNHFYSLNFDHNVTIKKVLEIIKNSNNFSSFYGRVYITATADEEVRGYGSKVHIENVYNAAKKKLKDKGLLALFSNTSLAEEQKNKSRKEFEQLVDTLVLSLHKPLPLATSVISSLDDVSTSSTNTRFAGLDSVYNPPVNTVNKNISLSNMHNFGSTCWLNSALKFIYTFYGYKAIKLAINKKLNDVPQLPTPELQDQLKKILLSFSVIIDAMSKNQSVNIQIVEFLNNIHNYVQNLPEKHKDKEHMMEIDKLLINSVSDNGIVDPYKILQQDADTFISPITTFLNLNSSSNKLAKKSLRTFIITKQNLNDIGLDITTSYLILKLKSAGEALDKMVQLPEVSEEQTPLKLNMQYFKDFCNRTRASFSSGSISNVDDNHQIPAMLKTEEKLFADINSLEKISLNTNYGKYTENGLIRDIDRVKANLSLMLPSVKIEVIDEKTNQSYIVEAIPETTVLFMGSKEVGGHYFTASIDDNGSVFIQNDMLNTTIEGEYYNRVANDTQLQEFTQKTTAEKLIEYIELQQAYPTSIGFKVISKTPIN